jgi:hypothetical protein
MLRTLFLVMLLAASPARAEMRLLMVQEAGCIWCAAWDAEVAPIYPLSAEGRRAPLWRHDINAPTPDGVTLAGEVVYTPTFILLDEGRETGRIEGYPGEAFFWGMLDAMLAQATEP